MKNKRKTGSISTKIHYSNDKKMFQDFLKCVFFRDKYSRGFFMINCFYTKNIGK